MGRLTKQQDDALTEALLAIHQGKHANLVMGRFLKSLQHRNLLDQSEVFQVQAEMTQGTEELDRALRVLTQHLRPPVA